MRILPINPKDLIEIGLMRVINQCLCHFLPRFYLSFDAPADNHMQAEPGGQQDARPPVPEEHSRELEPVEEESKLEPGLEHRKSLMLVHHHNGIYRVPVFQRVFYKALSITNPATNLIGCGDSSLLKTTRQKSDVFALLHELLQVCVVYRLHAPQLQNGPSDREVEDEPAPQPDDMRQGALLDRVHEHEEAEPEYAVGMYAEDTSILLGDYLFVDDLELVEVLEREEVFVDEIDVQLAASQGQLYDDQCQQPQEEVKIQCKNSINQNKDGSVKGELRGSEEQNRNNSLMPAEVSLLLRLIDHQHNVQYKGIIAFAIITSYSHFLVAVAFGFDERDLHNNFKMSSKKQQKKKGGKKDKEKDLQRQRMAQEQARKEQQRLEAQQRINILEKSGLLDAYEYFLRAICKNGLPEANIFEFAAQQILKYQKKMKIKEGKKEQLNNRSIQKEKQPSLEKGKRLDKSAQKLQKSAEKGDKTKPSVLPFKGQPKEEVLKALKK